MTYKKLRSDLDGFIRLVRDRCKYNTDMYEDASLCVKEAITDDTVDMPHFQDLLSEKNYWYARMNEDKFLLEMLEVI